MTNYVNCFQSFGYNKRYGGFKRCHTVIVVENVAIRVRDFRDLIIALTMKSVNVRDSYEY